jgi:U3 small nucleolar RNA-associated protein 25
VFRALPWEGQVAAVAHAWFRYSSNSEISRARTLFFKSKKSFLLVTERFHFYRRYLLRGAKTIVWYTPPSHAQFYAEFLHTPFLPSRKAQEGGLDAGEMEVEVDEGEISCRTLFSRFDSMKLERVVGSSHARRMLGSGEGRFEFI